MDAFKCITNETENETFWKFSGVMNENFQMPTLFGKKRLTINLKDIQMINSYGIKVWCKWVMQSKLLPKITLEECPFVFIKNISAIKGFISGNMTIVSFFVPFFNEDSQERKDILFKVESDYTLDGFIKIPKVTDSKGAEMELDVNKTTYFAFLKK